MYFLRRALAPTLLLSVVGSIQMFGKVDEILTLLAPSSTPSAHKSVLVGDLKLVDFKQFLANKGLQVEFAGGALQCGEYITVCKIGNSNQKGSMGPRQIVIEGCCARTSQDP